jgi:hypothetical protein
MIDTLRIETPKKQGGSRKGAGRPKAENKRVTLSVKILPEVKALIALQDKSAGKVIEEAILAYSSNQLELFREK